MRSEIISIFFLLSFIYFSLLFLLLYASKWIFKTSISYKKNTGVINFRMAHYIIQSEGGKYPIVKKRKYKLKTVLRILSVKCLDF